MLHIESSPTNRDAFLVYLFGFLPALCGRRKPSDYRMMPPDDAISRKANAPFFAEPIHRATCKTCRRIAIKLLLAQPRTRKVNKLIQRLQKQA